MPGIVGNGPQRMLDAQEEACLQFSAIMDPNQIIDALGGTGPVAKLCRVKSQAVSQWRRKGIPPARQQLLELLYPDVFNGRAVVTAAHDEQEAA